MRLETKAEKLREVVNLNFNQVLMLKNKKGPNGEYALAYVDIDYLKRIKDISLVFDKMKKDVDSILNEIKQA